MGRTKSRICTVTGMKTSEKNFYSNQTHVKVAELWVIKNKENNLNK